MNIVYLLEQTARNCNALDLVSLPEFLEPVLDRTSEDLLNFHGHANSILVAQFMAFVKTRIKLREAVVRQTHVYKRLRALIVGSA